MKQVYIFLFINELPNSNNNSFFFSDIFKDFSIVNARLVYFLISKIVNSTEPLSVNKDLVLAAEYKETNEKLIQKHKEYELAFKELDSIYSMESQIHILFLLVKLLNQEKK